MQTGRLHLTAKFHLKVFIVSASSVQITQFWANFDFWELLYRPPITDESQIWCATADLQQTFTCQNFSRSVYSIALRQRKTLIFAVLWTSAFSDVDSWRQSEKVEHGCTTTNLPLSNGIIIISLLQRLQGEIGRTNYDVQKCDVTSMTEKAWQKKCDGQTSVTDRHKNSTFFSAPVADEIRSPPNWAWW